MELLQPPQINFKTFKKESLKYGLQVKIGSASCFCTSGAKCGFYISFLACFLERGRGTGEQKRTQHRASLSMEGAARCFAHCATFFLGTFLLLTCGRQGARERPPPQHLHHGRSFSCAGAPWSGRVAWPCCSTDIQAARGPVCVLAGDLSPAPVQCVFK